MTNTASGFGCFVTDAFSLAVRTLNHGGLERSLAQASSELLVGAQHQELGVLWRSRKEE